MTAANPVRIAARRSAPAEFALASLLSRHALLLLPVIGFMAIFFLYPALSMMAKSFTDVPVGAGAASNYAWMLGEPSNLRIFWRTLLTAGWVTVCCALLGYPLAYAMVLASGRWRLLILGVVLLPYWTSFIVRNFAWIVILQDKGVLNQVLAWFGIAPVSLLGTPAAVTIGMTQVLLPFMVIPVFTAMRGIDQNLVRAATILGAHPIVAFFTVFLPLSLPGIAAGGLLVFVMGLGFYVTPAMLGSPSNAMLSQIIVTQVEQLLAWGRGSAMATVLLVTTLVILGAGVWLRALLSQRGKQG